MNTSNKARTVATGITVLIIEDNRDLARLFCDLVEVMGCSAVAAWNGKSGLQMAREMNPDIIFCDIGMPGEKNGLDVAREVRADQALTATRLLAVTGSDDPELHKRALRAGFTRVFEKPVKFAEIQEVLNNFKQS